MKETARHLEAFEYYYAMGVDRNLREVCQKYGITFQAVGKWSAAHGWVKRVLERDAKVATAVQKKIDRGLVRDKTNDIKLIEAAKKSWAAQLVGSMRFECPHCGKSHSVTVPKLKAKFRDLPEFVRLSELLAGGADTRQEVIVKWQLVEPPPRLEPRPEPPKIIESEVVET